MFAITTDSLGAYGLVAILQMSKSDIPVACFGEIAQPERNNIHTVNTYIAERLLAASKTDSSIDDVVKLDIYAMTLLGILDEPLEEIRHLFEAYLKD